MLSPNDLYHVVADIRTEHRKRIYAMEQRKRANLGLLSYLRLELGWQRSLPTPQRNAIAERAKELVKIGETLLKEQSAQQMAAAKELAAKEAQRLAVVTGGKVKAVKARAAKPVDGADDADFLMHKDIILASVQRRDPFDRIEAEAERNCESLVDSIPFMAAFVDATPGFGRLGAAVIIAEAANDSMALISDYRSKSALWKRMGLGLMHDSERGWIRQGGLSRSASADDWTTHGYNRMRRSRMWTIGDSLKKKDGHYRNVYLARKVRENEKAAEEGLTVIEAARVPKNRKHEFRTLGHIDKRAQRYMEKRLLRDIWNLWRANVMHAQHNQPTMMMAAE